MPFPTVELLYTPLRKGDRGGCSLKRKFVHGGSYRSIQTGGVTRACAGAWQSEIADKIAGEITTVRYAKMYLCYFALYTQPR